MGAKLFSNLIYKHFQYLVDDYGFTVVDEGYHPKLMGNAHITFSSLKTVLMIVLDRGQVLINIGPQNQPKENWFELSDVIAYFAPNLNPAYIFFEHTSNYKNRIESQVRRLAGILHKYCLPLLEGDFSMGYRIRELETKRVSEMLEDFERRSREYRARNSTD